MNKRLASLPVLLLLAVLCLVVFVRIRLLTMPLERDEGEFAYGGQLILEGIPPYKLFYNMKFPGIYAAYALSMAVFGQTDLGVHLGLLVANLLATWLLYRLALRLLDPIGAATAAATYALLSLSPAVLGPAAHATQFVVPAALGGLLLLLRGQETGKPWAFLCSGVCMALACLMKQPGAMFGLFGFTLLAVDAVRHREQWPAHVRRMACYILGGVAPFVLTGLVLWRTGVFGRFWFWTVTYARIHASELSWSAGREEFVGHIQTVALGVDGLFWILAALGLVLLLRKPDDKGRSRWIIGFAAFSAVAVCLSNYFSRHYFVMALPALGILTGRTAGAMARRFGTAASAGLIALCGLLLAFCYRALFFVWSPDRVGPERYFYSHPFVECREIGRYIRDHSPPGATVAVLGSEPEIYFYAHRHSATGYIYMYDFFEHQPYAESMQKEMIEQIEAARPEYMVDVNLLISWDVWRNPEHVSSSPIVRWAGRYVTQLYDPAGLIVFKPDSDYFWGQDAVKHSPGGSQFVHVFKRK